MAEESSYQLFHDGDVIIRQDTVGDEMYFIDSGTVRVYRTTRGSETVLADLHEGEAFGEMALFDNRPRSASAKAIGDTRLRVIGRSEFISMKCDPVIRYLLKALSLRLRAVNDAFARLDIKEAAEREELASEWEARHLML